ncbi:hypothetical protein NR996_01130 [Lactobacillus rodentium]|uniref:Uncharacterized protein n=1 Tax=Lactobacillus rodentium TaxID=947835 RepID=A0A2Z6TDD1_9LACO|nr:hypothetical protein [Lactobacillus rodentium]MCR1894015.1 hypothetical protein [Lactobacillus rodentium]GBG04120.1 hypothetical protein LrDSM24759_00340 [Lactobacillus rodentium]
MKIKQENIIKKIEEQDYLQDLETIKYSELNKTKIKGFTEKMIKEVIQAAKHDSLIQTQLAVAGQRPVTFALESNIINLPFANYKKISNFGNDDEDYEVNVYFETISEYVNVSGFRIDILGSVSEIEADPSKYSELLAENISEKLKVVRSYEKPTTKAKSTKK